MEKRNFKLYFTFAVIILSLMVFFTIENISLLTSSMEKPILKESVSIQENVYDSDFVTTGERQIDDFEEPISYIQFIKYLSLVLIGIFSIFAGYQIFYQKTQDSILSNELRMNMLIELREADKIPTYFSDKFKKSKSTISEHLDKLISAGLVEKVQEKGKKFVYYRITRDGKSVLRNKKAS